MFVRRNYNKISLPTLVELAYWLFFAGFFMLKSFYFQFTTKLNVRPFTLPTNLYMLLSTFGVLLIIISIIALAFNKRRLAAIFVTDLVLTLIIISDTIYYRYYYNVITVPVLQQIGLVDSVGDSIISLFKPKDIIYVLDLPFLIAGLCIIRKLDRPGRRLIRFPIRTVAALVLFAAGFASFKIAYKNVDTSTFPYDNNYVVRYLGVHYFHYYDIKRFAKENLFANRSLSASEEDIIKNFFNEKVKGGENFKGIAKGKNLLVVQVEALQQFVINRKMPDGREITPNLNKLIKDSVYFDNFYFQIGGGNTSDAEFLTNTSLYPVKEGCVYFRFPTNTFYSLPKYLKEQGYKTYVFHANNPSFWNRAAMYKSLGFDKFYSNNDFVLDEYVGWGLGDASFYRQSLDKIDTEEPFYGFMISLSSHFPYKYEYFENYDFDVGDLDGNFLGYYLKAINYADKAIGQLVEELKKRDLYDNTLLVIYGDHMAVPKDYSDELMRFLGLSYSDFEWAKLQKVPCLIRCPGLDKGLVVSTTGGEIDLTPTIANLMGFEAPYALGKDLLNAQKGYAVLRNSSVVTDKYIYLSSTAQAYDLASGRVLDKAEYEQELKQLQDELFISDLIIQKNAFKAMEKGK